MRTRPGEVRKRFALLNARPVDQIEALPSSFNKSALAEDFGDAAVAWALLPNEIFFINSRWETTGADNLNTPWILPDENRTAVPVIAMADGIEDGLAYGEFIESRHVPNEKSLLEMLKVITQVDKFPNLVEHEQDALPELTPVGRRSRRIARAIFKDNFGLPKQTTKCLVGAQQDEGRPGEMTTNDKFGINEQTFIRTYLNVQTWCPALPQLPQERDGRRIEIGQPCIMANLG